MAIFFDVCVSSFYKSRLAEGNDTMYAVIFSVTLILRRGVLSWLILRQFARFYLSLHPPDFPRLSQTPLHTIN